MCLVKKVQLCLVGPQDNSPRNVVAGQHAFVSGIYNHKKKNCNLRGGMIITWMILEASVREKHLWWRRDLMDLQCKRLTLAEVTRLSSQMLFQLFSFFFCVRSKPRTPPHNFFPPFIIPPQPLPFLTILPPPPHFWSFFYALRHHSHLLCASSHVSQTHFAHFTRALSPLGFLSFAFFIIRLLFLPSYTLPFFTRCHGCSPRF